MQKRILSGDAPFKLVEVIWDDAEAQTGWEDPPKKIKPAVAVTVGFLVAESDRHIIVASTIGTGENSTNLRLQIPRGMCQSIRTLQ